VQIDIIAVDKLRNDWARSGVAEYVARIERYCPVERKYVKPSKKTGAEGLEEEGQRLLKIATIGPRDRLVALAPQAESLASEGWARLLDAWRVDGVRRAVFAVGGADGLSPAVIAAADRRIALGAQTLAHELAQVVLVEQLYRAWTIVRGEPYHH
jgi:23S rRNA (pseudouridine1915-N3)-methyltransferase